MVDLHKRGKPGQGPRGLYTPHCSVGTQAWLLPLTSPVLSVHWKSLSTILSFRPIQVFSRPKPVRWGILRAGCPPLPQPRLGAGGWVEGVGGVDPVPPPALCGLEAVSPPSQADEGVGHEKGWSWAPVLPRLAA